MADESTPLLATGEARKLPKNVVARILFCSFMISLSFCFTQVPILYVFRLMTCDEYYKIHPPADFDGDRCSVNAIEASTARSVALLGASTTIFGTLNLLLTGALIKRVGLHLTLIAQSFWPSLRLCCQVIAVTVGGNAGIWIFQATQVITVVGGPSGYLLVLNTYISEVVEPSERTGVFGKLQGCAMFGGAFGFLLGGLSGEVFGIRSPFLIGLALMVSSTIYSTVFLPYIKPAGVTKGSASSQKGFASMMGPTRMLLPQTWRSSDGRVQKHWGVPLLALGVFLGVLATGYIPVLLQMYATSAFGFGPIKNGWLMSFNSLIRGFFLSLAFPAIISRGRKWFARNPEQVEQTQSCDSEAPMLPTENLEIVIAPESGEEAAATQKPVKVEEGSGFDLFFLRWSLVVDGILTGLATFTRHGWQIYLVAFILPLASGSASAAKSVMIEMCPISEKADALSAIALVEMIATLSTLSVFGGIFSALADIGKPHLTFACNAGVAVLAVVCLSFSKFPPLGSTRVSDELLEEDEDVQQQEQTVSNGGK